MKQNELDFLDNSCFTEIGPTHEDIEKALEKATYVSCYSYIHNEDNKTLREKLEGFYLKCLAPATMALVNHGAKKQFFIITSPEIVAALEVTAPDYHPYVSSNYNSFGQKPTQKGINLEGVLRSRWIVYSDHELENNKLLVGASSDGSIDLSGPLAKITLAGFPFDFFHREGQHPCQKT